MLLLVLCFLSSVLSQSLPPDPVLPIDFADPFVYTYTNGGTTYYAYATNGKVDGTFYNIKVMQSNDMQHWTPLQEALPKLGPWAKEGSTWAPTVVLTKSQEYVMYYVARLADNKHQCIGIATSYDPVGPFSIPAAGAQPIICQRELGGSIDPSVRTLQNGQQVLYWKSDENSLGHHTSRLWVANLTTDGYNITTKPVPLLEVSEKWEGPLIEAPAMLFTPREPPRLFYSANTFGDGKYAIGYGVCKGPWGPCTKVTKEGPWLKSYNKTAGPGGQEFFMDNSGNQWMCFHGWTEPHIGYQHGGKRALRLYPLKDLPPLHTLE